MSKYQHLTNWQRNLNQTTSNNLGAVHISCFSYSHG